MANIDETYNPNVAEVNLFIHLGNAGLVLLLSPQKPAQLQKLALHWEEFC